MTQVRKPDSNNPSERSGATSKKVKFAKVPFWSRWKYWEVSWRSWLYVGLYSSLLVLIINLSLLLVGVFSHGGIRDGVGTVAKGTAREIDGLSTGYHILINVLSTILLISSNYAMQILCAPTRSELDRAHSQGRWLDIGLVSLRNLRTVERRRVMLFWILAFSSVPLHLLYNSAVFHVTVGQDYNVDMIYARTSAYSDDPKFPSSIGWDRLDNKRWTELYRSPFVPGYGDLRLVVTDLAFWLNISGTHDQGISFHLFANKSEPSFEKWSCWKLPRLITNNGVNLSVDLNPTGSNFTSILDEYSVAMNVARLEAFALEEFILPARKTVRINEGQSAFRVVDEVCPDKACQVSGCQETGWLVNHPLRVGWALAKPSSRFSKVQIGSHFMLVVIFANLAKVGAIYWTLRSCKGGHIMTIGDAIASYLENPEKEYWGRCTLTRNELLHNLDNKIRPWRNKHTHIIWLLGRSSLRSGLLLPIMCGLNIAFFAMASQNTSLQDSPARYKYWGTSSQLHIPGTSKSFDTKGLIFNAWLANIPQVLLSISYFSINRICTSICAATEWNNFALRRKGLRVTSPTGRQRGTHFLHIPFRWSLPLSCTSGILHWLLSQSLFFVRIEKRRLDGSLYPESSSACGYSPLSFAVFTICFVTLLIVLLGILITRTTAYIPPAGHCSVVISAACHPPEDDMYAHLKRVQWGVIPRSVLGRVHHCSFTSGPVWAPIEGELYA